MTAEFRRLAILGPVVQLDRTSASEAESQQFESARDYWLAKRLVKWLLQAAL